MSTKAPARGGLRTVIWDIPTSRTKPPSTLKHLKSPRKTDLLQKNTDLTEQIQTLTEQLNALTQQLHAVICPSPSMGASAGRQRLGVPVMRSDGSPDSAAGPGSLGRVALRDGAVDIL
jgi:hypothetical protein